MDTQKPAYIVPAEALELQKRALQAFKTIATADVEARREGRALLRILGAYLAEDFPAWPVTSDDVRHAIAERLDAAACGIDAMYSVNGVFCGATTRAKWRTYRAADAAKLAEWQAHREAAEAKAQQGT